MKDASVQVLKMVLTQMQQHIQQVLLSPQSNQQSLFLALNFIQQFIQNNTIVNSYYEDIKNFIQVFINYIKLTDIRQVSKVLIEKIQEIINYLIEYKQKIDPFLYQSLDLSIKLIQNKFYDTVNFQIIIKILFIQNDSGN